MEQMYRVECCVFGDEWRVLDTVNLDMARKMAAFMRMGSRQEDVRIVNDDTGEVWVSQY